ncbi:MOSC domain-containing protein [Dermacoccaceae bacterium W4C1]
MQLSAINVHPVKSTAIRPVASAEVCGYGLQDDRRWMVVDDDGVLVSARECHDLFLITADTPSTDPQLTSGMRLRATGFQDLQVSEPTGPATAVSLHRHPLEAVGVGAEADAWLASVLGRSGVHLVWCADPRARGLNPDFSQPQDHTAFADGYPLTAATTASLDQLNDWIAQGAAERGEQAPDPLPMERFRPNVVFEGAEAFAEDDWQQVQIGQVRFRVAKPSDRCVMTSIDLSTRKTGKEPIRTLAKHRRVGSDVLFAVNLIPTGPGRIQLGDPVSAQT